MTESGSEDERVRQIKLTFKSTSGNQDIEVDENATIERVKRILSSTLNHPIEQLILIFSGKILKDHETLLTHNIKDGMAVHLVIKQTKPTTAAAPTSTPTPTRPSGTSTPTAGANPPPAAPGGGLGGLPGLGGMNADAARQVLNMPFAQELFSNPEFLRQMISGNEHIQSLARQNPEIGHLLNDPEMIRQTMDMIRNPNMFNEMMRNHDQAIRNLQGIPGGEAALQRLYTDIQEPLLNSTTGAGGNPFASSTGGANNAANTTSRSERAGVENAEALPNPWGGSTATSTSSPAPAAAAGGGAGGLGSLLGGLGGGSGMDASLQQMLNNPALQESMRAMMTPENMRAMMTPEMMQRAREAMGNIPGLENVSNQQLSDQMASMMRNPDFATTISNPRVIEAMASIRRNLDVIRTEAPSLYNSMFGGLSSSMSNFPAATGANSPPSQPPTATDAAAGTGAAGANPLVGSGGMQALIQQLMNNSLGAPNGLPADTRPPEQRFQSQLEQLVSMGFTNAEANLRAIQEAHGDVNGAIDRLLNR
uniref:Ubiquitin-like domain-containing protein n=1 Tax=Panagrellus redivivus TaxID=6233 RepID=A0A7E4W764_PANRE